MNQELWRNKLIEAEGEVPSWPPVLTLGFSPAHQWKLIEKIPEKVSSGIWAFDLETASGKNRETKIIGRENILRALQELDFGPEVQIFVRVNPTHSAEFIKDMEALIAGENRAAGIVLPKITSSKDIFRAAAVLNTLEEMHGLPENSFTIVGIVESAKGMQNLAEIVTAAEDSPRMGYLAYGEEDLRQDLGIIKSPAGDQAMNLRRNHFIDYVGGSDLQALDRVWTKVHDLAGLEQDTKTGLEIGFRGKMIISPLQISAVENGYTPSKEHLDRLLAIVAAYEVELAEGNGVATVNDQLIERQHYLEALQFLLFVSSLE